MDHGAVHAESRFGRIVWAAVLTAAIGLVIANFLSNPASNAALPAFVRHLTLWVADAQADPQAENVADDLSGYLTLGRESSTVGVLSGQHAGAVRQFLADGATPRRAAENLLVLTSTTLSEVRPGSSTAQRLVRAPLVAVLASDPLELAVPADSAIHTTAGLRATLVAAPGERLFGVAGDPWLTGNLAGVVQDLHVHGRLPYTSYDSSQDAVAALESGASSVVLAPRSVLASALAHGEVRLLAWPAADQPQAWVALAAPQGISPAGLERLRTRAQNLYQQPGWKRLLRADGLVPMDSSQAELDDFLARGVANAQRLQRLAAAMIEP